MILARGTGWLQRGELALRAPPQNSASIGLLSCSACKAEPGSAGRPEQQRYVNAQGSEGAI
jgi:hypothetical protein